MAEQYIDLKCKENVFKQGVHFLSHPTVSAGFGMRTINGVKGMHYGIDMLGIRAAADDIIAFADGKVIEMLNTCASKTPGSGNHVIIDHGNGYKSVYYHMKKGSVKVKEGQSVKKGDILGYMGTTGNSSGPHLHFGISINDTYVDPLPYLMGEKTIKSTAPAPAPSPSSDIDTYTIKKGDSLWGIAEKTMGSGAKYKELAEYNGLAPTATIYAGQVLNIPGKAPSEPKPEAPNNSTDLKSYMVKITAAELNIRKGPSTSNAVVGCIRDKGCYTIVETKSNWGRLKSGVGWICLDFTRKI